MSAPELGLEDLSNPPTSAELNSFADLSMSDLPETYKREPGKRVYAVRPLKLGSITCVGFDMDHTLAEYVSPAYEELQYALIMEALVSMGYPSEILKMTYNPTFAVRGLCLDTKLGNLIKLDRYGTILKATHGTRRLTMAEKYPSKFIPLRKVGKGRRFHLYDTLYATVEAALYADVVDHFDADGAGLGISYEALFIDIRSAVDNVHLSGALKTATLAEIEKYVAPAPYLPAILDAFHDTGRKVFLLTNSGYLYTEKVMDYLMRDAYCSDRTSWRDFFDVVIVSARKPLFFDKGSALREVERGTGNLQLHTIKEFKEGAVYCGGSVQQFSELMGARGSQVLYVGDHIFGDVIRSKASCGWRTLLIVRELAEELVSFSDSMEDYVHLANLEYLLAEALKPFDAFASEGKPDLSSLYAEIRKTVKRLQSSTFGSCFRTGSRRTLFASQVERFADIYAATVANLLNYPLAFYSFRPQPSLMPHERGALSGLPSSFAGPSTAMSDSDSEDEASCCSYSGAGFAEDDEEDDDRHGHGHGDEQDDDDEEDDE